MTQIHIFSSESEGLSLSELVASTKQMIRAEVTKDGNFKNTPPSSQWYVQKVELGHYRVVHNLNRKVYGVSVGSLEQGLVVRPSSFTEINFEVIITKDGQLYDASFVFALNFTRD